MCVAVGIWCFVGADESENAKPETWKGIYNNTKYLDEHERIDVTVTITEEDGVRGIEVKVMRASSDDAAALTVYNKAELALDKTDKISFTMKEKAPQEGSEMSDDLLGDVYIELEYVDEYTVNFKYGFSQEEMENFEAMELKNLAG